MHRFNFSVCCVNPLHGKVRTFASRFSDALVQSQLENYYRSDVLGRITVYRDAFPNGSLSSCNSVDAIYKIKPTANIISIVIFFFLPRLDATDALRSIS